MNPDSDAWKKHGYAEKDVIDWHQTWTRQPNLPFQVIHRLTGRDLTLKSKFHATMSSALTLFAKQCNVNVVGDKWPFYIDYIDTVIKAFPNAKFIYNIRDPRGIWNSAQRFKGRRRGDKILQEMLDKDKRISPYLQKPNFITIRYEDLVYEPVKTCQKLYQFLGCEWSEEYLTYNPQTDPYPQRWDWIPEASEQFNPRHVTKWKEQMEPDQIAKVNQLADWFIKKYQYGY
ncbi:MAG: hypothetical protein Kow00121_04440 [Elainellaceae cyanobacterium]